MRKSHTRERHVLGHQVGPKVSRKVDRASPKVSGLAAAAAEVDAAIAAADAKDRELLERGYGGTGADPGSIVGLDGFIPDGETGEQ